MSSAVYSLSILTVIINNIVSRENDVICFILLHIVDELMR